MNQQTTSTEKIRVIIVDDDRPSIEVLRKGLAQCPDVELVGTAMTLSEGLRLIDEECPDIAFLDVEFPEATAVDLLEAQGSVGATKIVFYSSYRKYLLKALRLQVFDFLLKPFVVEDLHLILHRYRLHRQKEAEEIAPRVVRVAEPRMSSRSIAITTITNDRLIVSADNIVYFRYDGTRKLWEAVLNTLEKHILKRHSTAENILNYGPDFVRTHKAYIVNISYLSLITTTECRLLPPLDNVTEIKISKNYRRELLDRFYDI